MKVGSFANWFLVASPVSAGSFGMRGSSLRDRHSPRADSQAGFGLTRQLEGRASGMEAKTLECVSEDDRDDTRSMKPTQFEFWYSVESTVDDMRWVPLLDRLIFHAIEGSVSWCYMPDEGGNRELQAIPMKLVDKERHLGLISFTSSPKDVKTNVICPAEKVAFPQYNCYVLLGRMAIVSHEGDDLAYTIATVLDAIELTMDNDELLSDLLPTVKKVSYLGDYFNRTTGEFEGTGTFGGPPGSGGPDDGTDGSGTDGSGTDISDTSDTTGDGTENVGGGGGPDDGTDGSGTDGSGTDTSDTTGDGTENGGGGGGPDDGSGTDGSGTDTSDTTGDGTENGGGGGGPDDGTDGSGTDGSGTDTSDTTGDGTENGGGGGGPDDGTDGSGTDGSGTDTSDTSDTTGDGTENGGGGGGPDDGTDGSGTDGSGTDISDTSDTTGDGTENGGPDDGTDNSGTDSSGGVEGADYGSSGTTWFGRNYGNEDGGELQTAESSEDDEAFGAIIAVSAISGVALLALLLLLLRKRRTVVTQKELDAAALAALGDDDDSSSADPPGSFHQGYYHYSKDGVRYLSQHCSTCLETERQLALGHGLETIAEDEVYDEGGLILASSKDLGGKHSTMNVHQCASATCKLCQRNESDPEFVKSSNKKLTTKSTGDGGAPDLYATSSSESSASGSGRRKTSKMEV